MSEVIALAIDSSNVVSVQESLKMVKPMLKPSYEFFSDELIFEELKCISGGSLRYRQRRGLPKDVLKRIDSDHKFGFQGLVPRTSSNNTGDDKPKGGILWPG